MNIVRVRNVHEALQSGLHMLMHHGKTRDSRVGKVLTMSEPVTTVYEKPAERVLFWGKRDANPFFHFMESLWMLAGRNDVSWISQFSSNISQFSDDGITFHGAYGYRWVNFFFQEIAMNKENFLDGSFLSPFNQIDKIVEMLKKNPDERRCVLQMWHAENDLGRVGKDVPCNTQIYFKISVDGRLNMTVCNRSNDVIWGAYGANAVHMSMLQEFVAACVGVPVGTYWQMSNDYHAYVDVYEKTKEIIDEEYYNPYELGISPFPMVNSPIEAWKADLDIFMTSGPIPGMNDVFFRKVVNPIWNAWFAYKDSENPKRIDFALAEIENCKAEDWKLACQQWLKRRKQK